MNKRYWNSFALEGIERFIREELVKEGVHEKHATRIAHDLVAKLAI